MRKTTNAIHCEAIRESLIPMWKNKTNSFHSFHSIALHRNKLCAASAYMHKVTVHIAWYRFALVYTLLPICYTFMHEQMNDWNRNVSNSSSVLERGMHIAHTQRGNERGKNIETYPIQMCLWIHRWEPFYVINWNWIFELCREWIAAETICSSVQSMFSFICTITSDKHETTMFFLLLFFACLFVCLLTLWQKDTVRCLTSCDSFGRSFAISSCTSHNQKAEIIIEPQCQWLAHTHTYWIHSNWFLMHISSAY